MNDTSDTPTEISEPLKKGKFVFEAIQEGLGEEKRTITFKPKLIIDYTIWMKKDPKTGKENYPEDVPILGFVTFNLGDVCMDMNTPLDLEHNWLINGYEGLNKNSSLEDVLMYSVIYDLFHLNDVKPHECYLCPMYIFYKHDGWRFPCKNRKCEPVDCLWESSYIGTKELEAVIEFYDEAIEKIKTMTNESLKKDNGKDNGFDFLVDIDKRIAKKYRLN